MADIGKKITEDFADKLAEKFVLIEQKEVDIETKKLKVFSDVFERQAG